MKHLIILSTLLLVSVMILGCSNSNPVTPGGQSDIPEIFANESGSGHSLVGSYVMVFDPDTMTVTVEPSRDLNMHLNVTTMLPFPGIQIVNWDPGTGMLSVDVTINNPYNIA